ncbi:hypothetical protein MPER_03596, partial [Moniliophthora perniciosa FA553]
ARYRHFAFFSAAIVGGIGRIPSWANIYERLWISDGEGWQTAQERGLSAGYALFLIFGVVSDWLLNRIFGECPTRYIFHSYFCG